MTNKKISEYVELTTLNLNDLLAGVDAAASETKKIKISTVDARYVNIPGDTMTGGLTIQPATDVLTGFVVNDKDANNVFTIDTINNRVGIGITTPTYHLSFPGQTTQTIWMERHTTANTAGSHLVIQAGGATLLSTDKAGGTLYLSSGISTGSQRSNIQFQVAVSGAAGTGSNLPSTRATFFSSSSSLAVLEIGGTTGSTTGLGINVTSVALSGQAGGGYQMYRHTTANTAGNNLTVMAGGATSGATDKGGGVLVLRSGLSTGTATSQIQLQTYGPAITGGVLTVTIAAPGSGYTTGDILTLVAGDSLATLTVTATAGAVTGVVVTTAGSTYGIANAVTTTVAPPGGSGCTINITSLTGTADNSAAARLTIAGEGTTVFAAINRVVAAGASTVFQFGCTCSPPVNSSAEYRSFNVSNVTLSTLTSTIATMSSVNVENRIRSSPLISTCIGLAVNGFVVDSSTTATAAATTIKALNVAGFSRPSGTTTLTATTIMGIDCTSVFHAGVTATNITGININNPATGTFTTNIGLDIAGQTRGATNIGLRIGLSSSGGTANYAIQLSDAGGTAAGGITFGTDTTLYRSAANTLKTDDSMVILEGLIVNENGTATSDFRVESDTEANMLFLDANADTDGVLYLGGTTNGVKIGKGGELTLLGTATVWEDLRVPVTSTTKGGSKDPGFEVFKTNGAGSQGVFTYWFDKAAEEELYFTVQLPHSWDATPIYPHVHWVPKSADAGGTETVEWGLEYTWVNIDGTYGDTTIVYAKSASGLTTAYKHILTSFTAITPGAGTQDGISSMMVCRIFRNATDAVDDTYDHDAGLLEFDIHYAINTMGSKTELAK